MGLASYTELRAAIADWLNRADLDAQIPDFVKLAESTLNRMLRDGRMVSRATLALTSGQATLPTDLLDVSYVVVSTDNTLPLEPVTPQQLMILRRSRLRAAGTPKFYSVIGRNILTAPIPSSATSLVVSYYAAVPALASNASNWVLENHPDLYLYLSLMHAAPFLKDEQRMAVFQSSVAMQIQQAASRAESLSLESFRVPGISLLSPGDMPGALPGSTPVANPAKQ